MAQLPEGRGSMNDALIALGWTPRFAEAFAPHRAAGVIAGARQPRAHPHLSRDAPADEEWLARVSGRLRHEASAALGFSRRRRLGRRRGRRDRPATRASRPCCRGSAASRAAPRAIPPRSRSSPRTSTSCSSSPGSITISIRGGSSATSSLAWESGATPGHRPQQGGSRRGSAALRRRGAALAPGVPVHAVSAQRPESLEALRAHLGAGRTGGAARIVRRRQVVDRQRADRRRAAAHARGARDRQPRPPHDAPAGSWCCCPAAAS